MSVCLLCQVRDTTQEPCGRLSFMKEPKSTRGLVHQAICNLNITLPIYTKVPWIILISNDLYCHRCYLINKGWVGGQNAVKALQAGVVKNRCHPGALSLLGFVCQCLKDSEEMTDMNRKSSLHCAALVVSSGVAELLSLFHTAISPRSCSGARRIWNSVSTSRLVFCFPQDFPQGLAMLCLSGGDGAVPTCCTSVAGVLFLSCEVQKAQNVLVVFICQFGSSWALL